MSLRLTGGSAVQTQEALQEIWKRVVPNREYPGYFQDDLFQGIFTENTSLKTIFSFIALLILFVASMGLFGLTSQTVTRNMKEIGIRKVLGATVSSLTRKLNIGFVIIVIVASIIATPLGYLGMNALLGSIYPDPVPIGPSVFLLSFGIILITALATISTQIRKISYANPADVLRND